MTEPKCEVDGHGKLARHHITGDRYCRACIEGVHPMTRSPLPLENMNCAADVHNAYGVGFHDCGRRASVVRNGVGFCKTHDPVAMKAKSDAWQAKWNAEFDAASAKREEAGRIIDAHPALVAACEAALAEREKMLLETTTGRDFDSPARVVACDPLCQQLRAALGQDDGNDK